MKGAEISTHRAHDRAVALAGRYARWRKSELGGVTDELEQFLLLEVLGDVRGLRVLDVGCGDGALAVELWRRGARVTGIDNSLDAIHAARRRATAAGADICFDVASAGGLPFADYSFDAVVTVTVLCFVEDIGAVLAEVSRVLCSGGRVVLGELARWNIWAALRRVRGWLGDPVWSAVRFRSVSELARSVVAAGLDVREVRGAIFYLPCGLSARLTAPLDRWLSKRTRRGAAFLVLSAVKGADRASPAKSN